MFLGEYRHNLDHKGRVSVPKKFRGELAQGAVLTKGLDGCLFLYSKESWQSLSERIGNLPITARDARAFARYVFAGAVDVKFDRLGRITTPDYLREYAKLGKEVVLIGVLERVEIWYKNSWEKFTKNLHKRGEEIAEKLSDKGI